MPVYDRPKIRLALNTRPLLHMAVVPKRPTLLKILPGAAAASRSAKGALVSEQAAAAAADALSASLSASFVVQSAPDLLPNARALVNTPTVAFDWASDAIVTASIPDSAITYGKLQGVSADKLLGSIGGGVVEEISLTAAGRALLDDASSLAQRATLELGNVDNTSDANKPVSSAQAAANALRLLLTGGTLSGFLTLHADPINAFHAVTKQYVDNLLSGLDPKASCRLATVANDTLSGLAVRDGITPVGGDRVFVRAQTAPAENGIYVASAGAWIRAADADTWNELIGAHFWIEEGTHGDQAWVCTNNIGGALGTAAVNFVQFGGTGAFQPLDADLTAIAALTTSAFGRSMLTVADPISGATSFGVGATDSPQFAGINLGHASDTTIARWGAGDIGIEGNRVFRGGGADVPVADGGTGAGDAAGARLNLGILETVTLACSDETTALTIGSNKMRWRIPWACFMSVIPNAALNTAQASGSIFTVDVNKNGTSILTSKLTIDNTETDSATAVTAPTMVTNPTIFAAGDILSVDIDQTGTSGAAGLKVTLLLLRT
jgi:hypothetical protein